MVGTLSNVIITHQDALCTSCSSKLIPAPAFTIPENEIHEKSIAMSQIVPETQQNVGPMWLCENCVKFSTECKYETMFSLFFEPQQSLSSLMSSQILSTSFSSSSSSSSGGHKDSVKLQSCAPFFSNGNNQSLNSSEHHQAASLPLDSVQNIFPSSSSATITTNETKNSFSQQQTQSKRLVVICPQKQCESLLRENGLACPPTRAFDSVSSVSSVYSSEKHKKQVSTSTPLLKPSDKTNNKNYSNINSQETSQKCQNDAMIASCASSDMLFCLQSAVSKPLSVRYCITSVSNEEIQSEIVGE